MSLSDVIRNITKTVTNKDELKEKAKDLPLLVVQTTLSAAGQALLLVDRVKNSIKGLGGKERKEEEYDSRPSAADQIAAAPTEAKADEKGEEDKPARREPVIFAPRPGSAEPNGAAKTKPDPVIFAPASKTDNAPEAAPKADTTAATATVTEPEAAPQPAVTEEPAPTTEPTPATDVTPAPATESKAAVTEEAEPVTAPKAPAAEALTADAPATEVEATKPAKPAKSTKAAKAAKAPEAAEAAAPVEAKAAETAAPEAPAAASEGAAGEPAEPLPGFSGLTVASLRARMRGKTAEQIGDYLAYEQATAARPEVIRMFENRLAKLQAGE
ncbi:hypothetical protein ABGB18_27590 [Nonomuraea sp. B12E4]|uniref:hypothetical protein n=1 Tax=Nonomuraea sp. B12E4 TaxID=3153564 RepID=UPI00325F78B2